MENLITYTVTVFLGFFAIINPIANTPIFLGLTTGETKKGKEKIAKTSTITAFIIVTAFIILGKYIFDFFGITIPAFKITGGILIFYVGFQMLKSQKPKMHNNSEINVPGTEIVENKDIAISPLAIPILAGPGTIVSAMNFVTDVDFIHVGIVIIVFAVMIYLTYLAFSWSDKIVEKVGMNIISVIGKLMGLLLAILGTGMITEGIKLTFNI